MVKILGRKISRDEIIREIYNAMLIIIGTVIIAFGTAVFLIPFDLVAGGISGAAIVLEKILPFSFITVDFIITVGTWSLFILGAVFLGKSFAIKTFLSTIIYPLCITAFINLASPEAFGGYFYLPSSEYSDIAFLIAALSGGTIIGIGCALSFLGGGSTGGTDVIAFILCSFFPRLKSSVAIFLVDAIIVVFGIFIIRDMIVSLLGIAAVIVCAFMIDKVFLGTSRAFICEIVTPHYKEISRQIIERLDRTTTVFDVVGGYSGEKKKMLKISFTMRQYTEVLSIISRIDKSAFVTVYRAHEINGEGWTAPTDN